MPYIPSKILYVILSLFFVLSACGGGGGGSSKPVPLPSLGRTLPTPSPRTSGQNLSPAPGSPSSAWETQEYRTNRGLPTIKASHAYARGATGAGVTVAVLDGNLNDNHPDLAPALHPESRDIAGSRGLRGDDWHGTFVAGVIGARKDGRGMHGVAYESRILYLRSDTPGSCARYCLFSHSNMARGVDYAVRHGARVINMSLGGGDSLTPTLEQAFSRAVEAGVILVAAAGNSGRSQPTGGPALFAHNPSARGRALVVGAYDMTSGTIAGFSNRAGEATKDFYILAPGKWVTSTSQGQPYEPMGYGTSFATPHVAGALALLLHKFPRLRAEQAVDILLRTADDLGEPGPDSTHGHGLMNLERAFQPVGLTTASLGKTLLTNPAELMTGPVQGAFGDWALKGKVFEGMMIEDSYERPFFMTQSVPVTRLSESYSGLLAHREDLVSHIFSSELPHGSLSLRRKVDMPVFNRGAEDKEEVQAFSLSWRLGKVDLKFGKGLSFQSGQKRRYGGYTPSFLYGFSPLLGTTHWAMATYPFGSWDLTARFEQGSHATAATTRLSKYLGQHTIGAETSFIHEKKALFGTRNFYKLGLSGGNNTPAISLFWQGPVGQGWYGSIQASLARPDLRSRSGLTLKENPWASAWSLNLSRRFGAWSFTTRLSQPLRSESGLLDLDIPTGFSTTGERLYETRSANLEPSGRSVQWQSGFSASLSPSSYLSFFWRMTREPRHVRSAKTEHMLWLGLKISG